MNDPRQYEQRATGRGIPDNDDEDGDDESTISIEELIDTLKTGAQQ